MKRTAVGLWMLVLAAGCGGVEGGEGTTEDALTIRAIGGEPTTCLLGDLACQTGDPSPIQTPGGYTPPDEGRLIGDTSGNVPCIACRNAGGHCNGDFAGSCDCTNRGSNDRASTDSCRQSICDGFQDQPDGFCPRRGHIAPLQE